MVIIKKILVVVMALMIFTLSMIPPKADANALVNGANAMKGAVISIMEGNGIKFANDEAREKAYEAWNMKAYEKWQEDEKNGRNQELWDEFNGVFRNSSPSVQAVEKPGLPGFAEVILSSNVYGLALLIGGEIGYGIQQAQAEGRYYKYAMTDLINAYSGLDNFNALFNLTYSHRIDHPLYPDTDYSNIYKVMGVYEVPVNSSKKVDPDPRLSATITEFVQTSSYYTLYLTTTNTSSNTGKIITNKPTLKIDTAEVTAYLDSLPVKPYEYIPKIDEVPIISPNPELEPLIQPNVNPDKITEVIPSIEPVPVVVPVETPWTSNPHVKPYVPPDIVPNPDPGPENPDNPGKDNEENKPIIPSPNPNNPTYPGTDPSKKPQEETPEYPEETTNPDEATQGGLFSKLWEWLKAILDVLFKILNAIVMLPFTLLEMLWDFLVDLAKALFVPGDNFWDDNMNELKKVIWADEMDEMVDKFSSIGDGSGGMFKDIVVSLMGVDGLVVIDADSINSILDTIHKWVRGVIYPLLILFNINSLYKMIRGTSLVEATRGLASRQKGGD